ISSTRIPSPAICCPLLKKEQALGKARLGGKERQGRSPARGMRSGLPPFRLRKGWFLPPAAPVFSTAKGAEGDGMKIERVVSPGSIEAWLVEGHTNPLIAIRFAFRGGASQDDQGKEGLAYFVSAMMDEGAGELNAIAFQERAQELAMRMDF